jgi:pimeloyl-ACP methyl ester carboxylesterase
MTLCKRLLRIGASVALICLLLAASGAAYNLLSIRHYRQLTGVPGKLYDVGGYAMHMYCTGEGSPTVVLSAGLGDDFIGWAKVQPRLSRVTRVCSYDRAGFGWSDSRPGVQDADVISGQLHQLVEAAGIERPFVLVGHSISGIYLRSYASRFPADLSAMAFVDGATPLQDDRIPKELISIQEEQRRQMPWQTVLMALGWYRLQGICTAIPEGFEAYAAWVRADACIPSQMDAVANELDAERSSGEETVHAGPFGDLPILILSHDPNVLPSNWPTPVAKSMAIVWVEMQEEAKHLSTRSWRVVAKGSDHYIQNDRPELVVGEIVSLVEMVRGHRRFPEPHTTTVE